MALPTRLAVLENEYSARGSSRKSVATYRQESVDLHSAPSWNAVSRRRFTFAGNGIIRNIRFTCDLLRPYIAYVCRWPLREATHASFQRDCAYVNYAPDVGTSNVILYVKTRKTARTYKAWHDANRMWTTRRCSVPVRIARRRGNARHSLVIRLVVKKKFQGFSRPSPRFCNFLLLSNFMEFTIRSMTMNFASNDGSRSGGQRC